jgi:hypothetical protein
MRTRIAIGAVLLVGMTGLAGCGGTDTTVAAPSTTTDGLSLHESQACALLYARLQRVTVALQAGSELVAHSRNPADLGRRIAIEQVQLERSADLMSAGPVPAGLVAANRRLVAALRTLSDDFARAKRPAAQGDLQAAVDAMSDPPAVRRIVAAAKAIERVCR